MILVIKLILLQHLVKKANSNSLDGRPSGGNAIIWNKNLNLNINLIVSCDYYLISELSVNESKILLVNNNNNNNNNNRVYFVKNIYII